MRAVICSVRCGDFLASTLPAWRNVLPAGTVAVATSQEDAETQAVCAAHDVPALVTDAWWRLDPSCHVGGAVTFNMALGMDEAFGFVPGLRPSPAIDELCVALNADVYPVGAWPDASVFRHGAVSGFWRHECPTPADLDGHIGGRPITKYRRMKNSGGRPVGYCQVFHWRPGMRFGSFVSAAKYDVAFFSQFDALEMRDDMQLLHLGGPEGGHANWVGRSVPRWGAA